VWLLRYATKGVRFLTRLGGYLAKLILLATTVLILTEIGSRMLLGRSTRLAEEISGYFLAAMILIGAAYTLASGEHIRILILRERLGPRAQRRLDRLALAVGTAFTGFLVVALYSLFHESLVYNVRSLHPSRTPMALPHGAVLVGAVLLWLQFLALFVESWFPSGGDGKT
jgi:TRAP-type C4-dicarboxylate transport system permease small subunit